MPVGRACQFDAARRRHATDQARAGLIKRMPDANVTKGHAK
jgi:hypothetical protein